MIERKIKIIDEEDREIEMLQSDYIVDLLEFIAEALELLLDKFNVPKPKRKKRMKRKDKTINK